MSALDELKRALAQVVDKLTIAAREIDAAQTLLEEGETELHAAVDGSQHSGKAEPC